MPFITITDVHGRRTPVRAERIDALIPDVIYGAPVTKIFVGGVVVSAAETADEILALIAAANEPARAELNESGKPDWREAALNEWFAKTDWVQEQIGSFSFNALGTHRADVLRKEIEHLRSSTLTRQQIQNIVHGFMKHDDEILFMANVDALLGEQS